MCDHVLGSEAHLLVGKVHTVVECDGTGEPEAAHMFCQRNLTINCLVTSERHHLNPFGKVVGGYK